MNPLLCIDVRIEHGAITIGCSKAVRRYDKDCINCLDIDC